MEIKHRDILNKIAETKDLADDIQKKLHEILKEFSSAFKVF
jgi:F0F1-type ATP synthase alpha subunit